MSDARDDETEADTEAGDSEAGDGDAGDDGETGPVEHAKSVGLEVVGVVVDAVLDAL